LGPVLRVLVAPARRLAAGPEMLHVASPPRLLSRESGFGTWRSGFLPFQIDAPRQEEGMRKPAIKDGENWGLITLMRGDLQSPAELDEGRQLQGLFDGP